MNPIVVVSGLPRSGTSMMMKMLEAAGIEALVDNTRGADENNPLGYYEFAPVKRLERDGSWLADASGMAVKVVSRLLEYLPAEHAYKVIFMRRQMDEIMASQRVMLERQEFGGEQPSDEYMGAVFDVHLRAVACWLEGQENVEVLYVKYNEVLQDPAKQAVKIKVFLGLGAGLEKMVEVVDSRLYRQRSLNANL